MEQQTTTARVALKYGLITAIASIVYVTMLYVTGQSTNTTLLYLGLVISIVGMVLAMKEFKEDNNGFMSYSQGLGIGTMMSAVSGFISGIYNYVYTVFIDPTIRQQILEKTRIALEEKGMDDDQIDQAMAMSEKFSSPGIGFAFGMIGAVIVGFILALIISAIMKREKPVFD